MSIRRPRKEGLGGPRARAASRPQPRTGQGVEADAPGSAASRARGKRDGCRPHRPALTSRVLGFRGCSRPGAGASRDHAAEKGAHGRCPLVRSRALAGSIRTAPQQPGRALLATDLQGRQSTVVAWAGRAAPPSGPVHRGIRSVAQAGPEDAVLAAHLQLCPHGQLAGALLQPWPPPLACPGGGQAARTRLTGALPQSGACHGPRDPQTGPL